MAAANPCGGDTVGGAGGDPMHGHGGDGFSDGEMCGSSMYASANFSPQHRAAAALAKAVVASPANLSHQWTSPFGGV